MRPVVLVDHQLQRGLCGYSVADTTVFAAKSRTVVLQKPELGKLLCGLLDSGGGTNRIAGVPHRMKDQPAVG